MALYDMNAHFLALDTSREKGYMQLHVVDSNNYSIVATYPFNLNSPQSEKPCKISIIGNIYDIQSLPLDPAFQVKRDFDRNSNEAFVMTRTGGVGIIDFRDCAKNKATGFTQYYYDFSQSSIYIYYDSVFIVATRTEQDFRILSSNCL